MSLPDRFPASSEVLAGPPCLLLCPPPHNGAVSLSLLRITNTAQHLCIGPRCVCVMHWSAVMAHIISLNKAMDYSVAVHNTIIPASLGPILFLCSVHVTVVGSVDNQYM